MTAVSYARTGARTQGDQHPERVRVRHHQARRAVDLQRRRTSDHYNLDYTSIAVTTGVATNLTNADNLSTANCRRCTSQPRTAACTRWWPLESAARRHQLQPEHRANSAANPKFDPQETTNYEVGTKWDLLDQKLSLTGALFRTEVKNEIEQDPTNTAKYYQNGKKRVQGIELGVTGEICAAGWSAPAMCANRPASKSGKIITASGDNQLTYTPKQAFTLWSSYTLPFGLQIWRRRPLQRQAGARHRRRRRHPGLRRFVLGVRRHGVVPDQQAHRPAPERVQPGRQGIRASDQQVGLPLHPRRTALGQPDRQLQVLSTSPDSGMLAPP
jgi:hypothetical protein